VGEIDTDFFEASQSALNKKKAKVPVQRIRKTDTLKREAPKWDPERINKETLFVMGSRHHKNIFFRKMDILIFVTIFEKIFTISELIKRWVLDRHEAAST
jgi:hypothetical protein